VKNSASITMRIVNRLGRPFGVNPYPRAFENEFGGIEADAKTTFDEIFRRNYWGSSESRSGVGSEARFALRYGGRLKVLLERHGLQRVFDAPCGDLNWMADIVRRGSLSYQGGDISPEVVSDAGRRHPELDVRVFDITTDRFPSADVWHCRDCLFHLPFEMIWRAFERVSESSIPFVLITTHSARLIHKNLDVGIGGFRFLDLERPPFSFPAPIDRVPDFRVGTEFPRYVALWTTGQLRGVLAAANR